VFSAHVNVEARKKCQALFKLLGMDGEWSNWIESVCGRGSFRHFLWPELLTYFVSIFCDVTRHNWLFGHRHFVKPFVSIFNSEVALHYLDPWRRNKHTPRRCGTTYRSYLKERNISCSAWTLNMKCVGCLETSVRNLQPTLHKPHKSGAMNFTATKALNMPSVDRSHCCNMDTHTNTAERLLIA